MTRPSFKLRGLTTYFSILAAPRLAFARLATAPTWGWAALCGLAMTLLAVLIAEKAQLHLLALTEAHRLAHLPPGERLQEHLATAQVAPFQPSLFILGALTAPWVVWFLIALFFFIAAALGRGRANFSAAWIAALNSYVVYALGGVINAILVAARDPMTLSTSLDLVRLPSPGWLTPHSPVLGAFLSAYNAVNVWYYAVVFIALEQLLRLPRVAALTTTIFYSLMLGVFAAMAGRPGP